MHSTASLNAAGPVDCKQVGYGLRAMHEQAYANAACNILSGPPLDVCSAHAATGQKQTISLQDSKKTLLSTLAIFYSLRLQGKALSLLIRVAKIPSVGVSNGLLGGRQL